MNVTLALILTAAFQIGDRYATTAPPEASQSPAAGASAAPAGDSGAVADPDPASALNVAEAATSGGPDRQIELPAESPQPTFVGVPDPAGPAVPPATPTEPTLAQGPTAPGDASTAQDAAPPADASAAESSQLPPKPADLMRVLLKTPVAEQLAGVPVTLGEAMRDATTRTAQTERAEAYWNLSAAVAQHYLALQESAELAAMRQWVAQPAAAWDVAASDLAQRVTQTRDRATAAQLRLHRLMGATAGVSLPLPADAPHCGRYNTRFEEIFAGRPDPAASQLNDLLPQLHAELVADVRLVAEASEWLNYVNVNRDAKTDGTGLLRAYELMALRRREFIEAAREYNHQIAAYAELAAPDQVGPERLVAMLIRVSHRDEAPATGVPQIPEGEYSAVTQASAVQNREAYRPQSPAPGEAAAAEREPGRVFSWRPFERLRNREHTIVTSRRLLRRPLLNRD